MSGGVRDVGFVFRVVSQDCRLNSQLGDLGDGLQGQLQSGGLGLKQEKEVAIVFKF